MDLSVFVIVGAGRGSGASLPYVLGTRPKVRDLTHIPQVTGGVEFVFYL